MLQRSRTDSDLVERWKLRWCLGSSPGASSAPSRGVVLARRSSSLLSVSELSSEPSLKKPAPRTLGHVLPPSPSSSAAAGSASASGEAYACSLAGTCSTQRASTHQTGSAGPTAGYCRCRRCVARRHRRPTAGPAGRATR
eukprot:365769-Chlamydomonas_euryale.AAC.2